MKQVKATKYPSLVQMSNMAFNLREKYHKYCAVDKDESANAHLNSKVNITIGFKIYTEPILHSYKFWSDLQIGYQKLMEGSS